MIRLSVIGVGRMGGMHAKNIYKRRVQGACLAAVCDIDTKKFEYYNKDNKVLKFQSVDELIQSQSIDAVIIATPHYSHVEIAKKCLAAGLNVLVEKPISVSYGEAYELNKFAKKYSNQVFAIMYNQRTNRMYSKAKELIESGALGEIRRANFIITDWYRSQAYYNQGGWRASWSGEGGGALINQCVHQLDILQWLIGMPEKIIAKCNTRNRNITVENEVIAMFEYPNKVFASFTAATNELRGINRLEIAGSKGRIMIGTAKMKYIAFKKSEQEVNATTKYGYGWVKSKTKRYYYGFSNAIKDLTIGQQINIVKNFVNAINGKEELISRAEEGINGLSLINGIYLSDYLNGEVSLPIDSNTYDKFLEDKVSNEIRK